MKNGRFLEGIRIVDMTAVIFGPFCTQLLADLGAEVIKVEPLTGDAFRHYGTPAATAGMGPVFMNMGRGKKSVALNLKDPVDLKKMRNLLRTADAFIHNVRGDGLARLGLSYDAVKALRPDIIYAQCSGFGSGGPYAGLGAYDDVIQAATGAVTLAPMVDGDERPRYIPSAVVDKVGGLYGAYAMLAAIIHRIRTGEGQSVEIPMFETFTQFMLVEHFWNLTFVPPTGSVGYARQIDPARQPFPTKDGYISIVPQTDDVLLKLFEMLGDSEFLRREPFDTVAGRAANMTPTYARMAELTPAKTTKEWWRLLSEAGIPAMPVRQLADIVNDPHLQAVDFFIRAEHPTEGTYYQTRLPVKFSELPDFSPGHAPHLNQHVKEFERVFSGGDDDRHEVKRDHSAAV